jgi:hypothetical protein
MLLCTFTSFFLSVTDAHSFRGRASIIAFLRAVDAAGSAATAFGTGMFEEFSETSEDESNHEHNPSASSVDAAENIVADPSYGGRSNVEDLSQVNYATAGCITDQQSAKHQHTTVVPVMAENPPSRSGSRKFRKPRVGIRGTNRPR